MKAEVSYDLVMEDDMSFVEGTYRLPGGEWQVFIFIRRGEVSQPAWKRGQWESGVTGLEIHFPRGKVLNRTVVQAVLSEALGASEWEEVRGPDSLQIR